MILMSRFRRPHGLNGLTIWPMLLVLLWTAGCARPTGLQSNASAAPADQHQVPFHDRDGAPARPGDASATQDNGPNPETGLPFHDPQNLPAGTLLTVRLKDPISAENPGANGTFEAVIDEPVVVEGNKLVPRGVTVAGRVESAQASNLRRNRGYVRLALDSIHLAGANLPIQTSSLFVRGNAGDTHVLQGHAPQGEAPQGDTPQIKGPQSEASAAVIRLEKGRRLTFRLTEPVYVAASQRTRTDR
jgi:hypothetical protein